MQMKNNYSVYQHVTPDGFFYFGQSQNVERRWSNNGSSYKETALQPYIEKFGWDNIQHIVLYENLTYEDALKIEDSLIISGWEKGNCINKRRSGNISKEEDYNKNQSKQYYETNKGQILERHKQYYEQNKDKKLEYQQQYREQNKNKIKQYYETNKGQILERQKQYYETNKGQILEQKQQYREKNKDKIQEYNRQYYQRKKKEKQFKELGCLPLF